MVDNSLDNNPFLEQNFAVAGGLWEGKVVTFTSAKTEVFPLRYGDGTPVISQYTNEPSVLNVLAILGIADDEEKERKETYDAKGLIPTADGEGFVKADGTPGVNFPADSEMAKLSKLLKEGGYDVSLLWDATVGRTKMSKLTNARFRMKGFPQLDKAGAEKKNAKGFVQKKFYPVEFLGYKEGRSAALASGLSDELRTKAVEVFRAVLADAGGSLSRRDLIRVLDSKLAGDKDRNKILALVTREEFHKDVPWTKDGTGYTL